MILLEDMGRRISLQKIPFRGHRDFLVTLVDSLQQDWARQF